MNLMSNIQKVVKQMLYQKIGVQIRKYRKRKGMTQEQLSDAAGISLSFLGHIERGTRKLSVDTLYSIATVLNCSVDELMETGRQACGCRSALDLLNNALLLLEEQENSAGKN